MRALAAAVVVSLLFVPTWASQSVRTSSARTGLIVGQVVDAATGRPVSGCIVSLAGAELPRPAGWVHAAPGVLTTSDGRFVFRDLPAGNYGITATRQGYADGAHGRRRPGGATQQLELDDGERIADVVIHVWKHGAISGTIVDEAGEPVVNALVVALRRSTTIGTRAFRPAGHAATDDRGVYRLSGLPAGDYVVGASVRHFSMPAIQGRTVRIDMGGAFEAGFTVGMVSSSPTLIHVDGALYLIGGGGAIPPPPAADRMFVYRTTYYSSATSIEQASVLTISSGEERGGADLQLIPVPAARLSGSIGGPDGPVSASVLLVPADSRESALEVDGAFTVSDARGLFAFQAVPSGRYFVQARVGVPRRSANPGAVPLWADLPVVVGDTDISGLHVQLQRGFRISGRFEFEGGRERPTAERLQQVPVVIQTVMGRTMPPPALTVEADGRFTVSALPPDRYFVRIDSSPPGWRFKSATHAGRDVSGVPLDLRGDADVTITFSDRWSHLRGMVTTSRGVPDPEAIVLLFPADTQQWPHAAMNSRRFKSARATTSGEYTINSVPEGEYFVVAVPDVDAADWQAPDILQSLANVARRMTLAEGETRVEPLGTQEIR
jgi:hypothetical protein